MCSKFCIYLLLLFGALLGEDTKMPYQQKKIILRLHNTMSKWLSTDQLAEFLNHLTDELYIGKDVNSTLNSLKDKVFELHTVEQNTQYEQIKTALDNAGIPYKAEDIGKTIHEVLSNNFRAVLGQLSDFAVNCHENGLAKPSTAKHVFGLLSQFLTKRMSTTIICRLVKRFDSEHWSVIQRHLSEVFHFHAHDCSKHFEEEGE